MKKILAIAILMIIIIFLLRSCGTTDTGITMVDCAFCKASGVCNVCKGAGENSYAGNPARTCTICHGDGQCAYCGGEGEVTVERHEQNQSEAQKTFSELNAYLNQDGNDYDYNTNNNSNTNISTDKTCYSCSGSKKCHVCNGIGDFPCPGSQCISGKCAACDGTGVYDHGSYISECIVCNGDGICDICKGTKRRECTTCSGSGICTHCR